MLGIGLRTALVLALLGMGWAAVAQEQSTPSLENVKAEDFPKLLEEWKSKFTRRSEIFKEHQEAEKEEQQKLEEEFRDVSLWLETNRPVLAKAAKLAFPKDPKKYAEAGEVLTSIAIGNLQEGSFQKGYDMLKLVLDAGSENPRILPVAGVAAMEVGELQAAQNYLTQAKAQQTLGQEGEIYLEEVQARLEDAKAGNNPKVELKTSKGTITLELFEDEAPNTVANFIHLVEKDFYDGLTFHRVLEGFMAQGGDPKGDGTGGPGYNIACECYKEEHRKHFRGSLAMAHAGKDTGGSQFYITFVPTSHLNGKHTVFGRVIEGFDALDSLQKIDPSRPQQGVKPDKIIEAKVISKRDHPYVPKVTPEEEAEE